MVGEEGRERERGRLRVGWKERKRMIRGMAKVRGRVEGLEIWGIEV